MAIAVKTGTLPSMSALEDWIIEMEIMLDDFSNYAVKVKTEDRSKHQSMGSRRKEIVEETLNVSKLYSDSIPRGFDLAEYENLYEFFLLMQRFVLTQDKYRELIEDTFFAVKTQLVEYSNACHGFLKASKKVDGSLDTAVKRLADLRKQSVKDEKEATKEPPPTSSPPNDTTTDPTDTTNPDETS